MEVRRTLAATTMGPSEARVLVRTFKGVIPPPLVEDLAIIVSELTTNVVHHSGLSPEDTFEIRVSLGSSVMRVEIRDEGLGEIQQEGMWASRHVEQGGPGTASLSEGGRGLQLVAALSSRFSVEKIDGTAAWAEIDLPSGDTTGT